MSYDLRITDQAMRNILLGEAIIIGWLVGLQLEAFPAYFELFSLLPLYVLAGSILAIILGVFVALLESYVEYWDNQPKTKTNYLIYSALTLIVAGWLLSVMINWLFMSLCLLGIIDMFLLMAYTPVCSHCSKNLNDKKSYSVKSGRTYCEKCFDRMGDDFLSYELPEPPEVS